MVYNSDESKIYMFGGADEKEVKSDLYYLENFKWKKVRTKHSPLPRTFSSMIYDKNQKRIILFGGNKVLFGKETKSSNLLNDTWQFKNGKWTKLKIKNAPTPRAEASMVFDPIRNIILLYGGYTITNKQYIKLGDTWLFHENNWIKVSEKGPISRNGANMIYDMEKKNILLFGGSTIDKQYGNSKGETWLWSGKSWNKIEMDQPPGIYNSSMIYNKFEKTIYRFGGWNGNSRINETWIFKNENWERLNIPISPKPRNHTSMVFDEKEK
jgi:hypothetical protein